MLLKTLTVTTNLDNFFQKVENKALW